MAIESLSAITLSTRDMVRAIEFYEMIGFERIKGSGAAGFASFRVGAQFLNIQQARSGSWTGWGRVIFHVSDVDVMYRRALARGIVPDFAPRDAPWGERYFHVTDPDGHEISFARSLAGEAVR